MKPQQKTARALLACYLAALLATSAGCSQFGKPEQVEPNIYPANYKADLLAYLRKNPDDLVNASATYMRIDGQNGRKEKFVVFFSGLINQFVDATTEQCGAAAYQPFPELLAAFSPPSGKK